MGRRETHPEQSRGQKFFPLTLLLAPCHRSSLGDETLKLAAQVFGGDADDTLVDTQEERLLRMWLCSLDPRITLPTLFDPAMHTVRTSGGGLQLVSGEKNLISPPNLSSQGWPLLLAAEAIQPGSVHWSKAFEPPYRSNDKAKQIKCACNCNMAIDILTQVKYMR